tara:strand:- start:535 stop:1053 length:519 start_codon:yes stop_codon:yes gene_type:complete
MKRNKVLIILTIFSCYAVSIEPEFQIKKIDNSEKEQKINKIIELDLTYDNNLFKAEARSNAIEAIPINQEDSLLFKNLQEESLFNTAIASVPKNHFFVLYKNEKNEVTSLKILGDIFRYDLSHTRVGEKGPAHRHNNFSKVDVIIPTNGQIKSLHIYQKDIEIRKMSSYQVN